MKNLLLTLVVLFSSLLTYGGEGSRRSTSWGDISILNTGARNFALNSSNISGIEGIEALNYNPAGPAASTQLVETMFSYMTYDPASFFTKGSVSMFYGGVSSKLAGYGTLSVSLKYINYGDDPISTAQFPEGTGDFTHQLPWSIR